MKKVLLIENFKGHSIEFSNCVLEEFDIEALVFFCNNGYYETFEEIDRVLVVDAEKELIVENFRVNNIFEDTESNEYFEIVIDGDIDEDNY